MRRHSPGPQKLKAILLCAGKGTRLLPLTVRIPKAMVEVGDKPVVEWLLILCKKHCISEIGINLGRNGSKIKKYLQNGDKWGVKISYSQEKQLLGTAGALHGFDDFLNSTFIVIYGDILTDINITKMLCFHRSKRAWMTIALKRRKNPNASSGLAVLDDQQRIKVFIEKPMQTQKKALGDKNAFTNCGVYICEPKILKYIPKGFCDFGYSVIPKITQRGKKVFGYDISRNFFQEIGTVEKVKKARKMFFSAKGKGFS